MFGKATDEWCTPQAFWRELDQEFDFWIDAAATSENRKCAGYWGPDHEDASCRDALRQPWAIAAGGCAIWLNCPYSRCRQFIAKAAQEARSGATVVALVPSRTDTRWWHSDVWDAENHHSRPGVEIRFIKGRLKFGASENSAPFPSVVIVFRPVLA